MSVSVVTRKSPLHPSALGLNDLFAGQKVLIVSVSTGTVSSATVVEPPFVLYEMEGKAFHVLDLLFEGGESVYYNPALFGVAPYVAGRKQAEWSEDYFLIDQRKQHLL
jgi:hypothetical protein